MTRDNDGRVDTSTGDPGPELEPADVIQCRECGSMVRRVNSQHLTSDRCVYTDPEEVRTGDERPDLARPDHPETVEEYREKYPGAPVMSPRERMELSKSARDDEVDERRRELLRRRWNGESMTNIVESLADRYGVSEDTVWKDWTNRSDWIGVVFGLSDTEAVVQEALAQKRNVRERLMRLARRSEDENELNAAIRALKAVDANLNDTVEHEMEMHEMLEDRGIDPETGEPIDVESEDVTGEQPGEDLSEETLRQLDEITGGEADPEPSPYETKDDGDG